MILYPGGQEALVGDKISIDAGLHTGIVKRIVESQQDIVAFGVHGVGLIVDTDTYGQAFIATKEIEEDEVTLLSRHDA
jgi:hypothetical protein